MIIIIMTIPCYKSGKSMIIAACYKGGKLMMTNLIIIKIKIICYEEDKVGGLYVRLYARVIC